MNGKEILVYSPDGVTAASSKEQNEGKDKLTERLRSLVEHEEYESQYQKGFFQRETHSKQGEHILLVYNDHSTITKRYIPPQLFIQVYLPGHTKTDPKIEEYKWTIEQDPNELYLGRIKRIEDLIGLFEPEDEVNSDEA